MAVERIRKNTLTKTSAFGLFQLCETGTRECRLIDFNDECAQLRFVSVVMCIEASELSFCECLCQCFEPLGGAEPGEAVCHQTDRRPEFAHMAAAHQGIDTVLANHEIDLT